MLCFLLAVNNIYIVFADSDIHGGSDGSFDPNDPTVKYPELFDKDGHVKPIELPGQKLFGHMILGNGIGEAVAPILSTITDFLSAFDNSDDAISIDKGGSTIHFHERFVNELNQTVQDKVHALDGYYLIEPQGKSPAEYADDKHATESGKKKLLEYTSQCDSFLDDTYGHCYSVPSNILYYLVYDAGNTSPYTVHAYNSSNKEWDCARYRYYINSNGSFVQDRCRPPFYGGSSPAEALNKMLGTYTYGLPFKVFYSKESLQNYLNNNEKRTYAPQLPSTTISIPIKYINNSVSLPDITYNINTTNKTEVEIQNEYNTTLNNYLNDLNNFTDGSETTPTPTPDGGFTDGTTPTPTPSISDGGDDSGNGKVDLSEITDLLKKILDKLTSFADSHSKFEKTITDYIEANDGKLDQIIEAINALSDGKTEDEKNGCKYDFTALSDFMTKLWNESDKKFDKMVELLEENNKYQKKLVNSLNEIKAILVTQTIMDVFQDRSQQTAEKAKGKFPTSLPWDIALVVNAMSAEPEKPQFNLPIQIKSLNINEEIHVDLATGEWEKLAKTCRYLLSILFILLMIQLSRKLFSNGGDD